MTAQEIVEAALREIGVLGISETLSAQEAIDGLARLNRLVSRLATENLVSYTVTRTTATLTANQASFTVGAGGNINIARPVWISKVNFIDTSMDPDYEFPLGELLSEQEYQAIPMKAFTAVYPLCAYYNPTYPTGTLIPYPIPTSATLLWAVYACTAVTEFSTLATAVSLPPGYEEMLVQNLALNLCPSYERNPHPVLVKNAAESMAAIKRANVRRLDLRFGADLLGDRRLYNRPYSSYTDQS